MNDLFDFIVIGGGSAGYAAAAAADNLGLRVAVVEGGGEVGGLCILRGCMPSKTLIESANRFRSMQRAPEFGLRASGLEAVGEEIIARKRRLIAEFAEYRQEQLMSGRFEFVRGLATFLDPNTIEVRHADEEARVLKGRTFLVATGSRLNFIDLPGLREVGVLDSDRVLEHETIPKSIVVLGAGAISMEFAHYFAGLGSEVAVVQRSLQVLSDMDLDVAEAVSGALEKRGVRFHLGSSIRKLDRGGRLKRVEFDCGGKACSVEAEEVLYALGRRPHSEGLSLDRIGVETIGPKIRIEATQQTTVPHIFAAGDVCGPYEIVHIAIQQGELAARNAAKLLRGEGEMEEMDYRLRLMVVFSDPEVATVGLSERELIGSDLMCSAASHPFGDHGKSMVMGEEEGFVKLIAAKETGEILGGAVVGPHAADLIHEIVVAMHFRATAADLAGIPHYHPTLSEIWTYPAEELAEKCGAGFRTGAAWSGT